MFYYIDGRVYLATKDAETGMYPEVVFEVHENGEIIGSTTGYGVFEKPRNREVLTWDTLVLKIKSKVPTKTETKKTYNRSSKRKEEKEVL